MNIESKTIERKMVKESEGNFTALEKEINEISDSIRKIFLDNLPKLKETCSDMDEFFSAVVSVLSTFFSNELARFLIKMVPVEAHKDIIDIFFDDAKESVFHIIKENMKEKFK